MTRKNKQLKEENDHHKESKDATFQTVEDSFTSNNDVSISIDCHDGGVECISEVVEPQLPSYFDAELEDQTVDVPSPLYHDFQYGPKTKKAYWLAAALLLVFAIAIGVAAGTAVSARNQQHHSPSTGFDGDNLPSSPDNYAGSGGEEIDGDDNDMGPKKAYYNAKKRVGYSDNKNPTPPTTGSKPADDMPNEMIIVAELPSTSMGPPEYASSPPSPSCSQPPAWADARLSWWALSIDQRKAALYLGYTSSAWDANGSIMIGILHGNLYWSDLSSDQRRAYEYLGYNSGSYEYFYNYYFFEEMPEEAQDAAVALGYTPEVWDECDFSSEICVPGVDDMFWMDLSEVNRMNLMILGWDCWTWNNYDLGGTR